MKKNSLNQLVHLKEVAYQDSTDIRKNIKEIVDTYQPQNYKKINSSNRRRVAL